MSGAAKIRVLSVDDHPLLHEGIATVIRNQPDMLLVAEAFNGRDGILQFRQHRPDVTLMDLRLPDISGIDAMVAIHSEFPSSRNHSDDLCRRCGNSASTRGGSSRLCP
jgi:DNA-binding NarL/FixJ family response regulator